jgi:hypothetical protein
LIGDRKVLRGSHLVPFRPLAHIVIGQNTQRAISDPVAFDRPRLQLHEKFGVARYPEESAALPGDLAIEVGVLHVPSEHMNALKGLRLREKRHFMSTTRLRDRRTTDPEEVHHLVVR